MFVYIQSQKFETRDGQQNLWTVGFYDPEGKWNPESDHSQKEYAAARVHYLNGGSGLHDIEVFVEGGVIQDITGIPKGIKINVYDFDTDGIPDESLSESPGGDKCIHGIWEDNQ